MGAPLDAAIRILRFAYPRPGIDITSRRNLSIASGGVGPASSSAASRARFRDALTRLESRTAAILRFITSPVGFVSGIYRLIAISSVLFTAAPRGLAYTSAHPPLCISPHYLPTVVGDMPERCADISRMRSCWFAGKSLRSAKRGRPGRPPSSRKRSRCASGYRYTSQTNFFLLRRLPRCSNPFLAFVRKRFPRALCYYCFSLLVGCEKRDPQSDVVVADHWELRHSARGFCFTIEFS